MKLIFGNSINKLFAYLFFYMVFSGFTYLFESWLIYNFFYAKEFSHFVTYNIHICYYFLFCILMWKDLYSLNYHYFLKYESKWVIFKNISVTFIVIFNMVFFMLFFDFIFGWNYLIQEYLLEILVTLVLDTLFIILAHVLQFLWIHHLVRLGFLQKNVLIVGEPDERFPIMDFFVNIISTNIYTGTLYMKEGQFYFRNPENKEVPVTPDAFKKLIFSLKIGEVMLFMNRNMDSETIFKIVNFCRLYSIGYYLVPDISNLPKRSFWKSDFYYIPLIERYATNRDSVTFITFKRLFDLVVASLSLLLVFPVAFLIALAIKLEDGGPVFFVRNRVGKNGKIIKFYKFRSMVPNADVLKNTLLKYNMRKGPLFKMKNDPRITRIGKLLRRHSLDELPQLLNVLKGDMSLIGPRPHLVSEVAAYSHKDVIRLDCIPGIACYPQIYGRDTLSFRKWVNMDILYRKKWSIGLDLNIFFRCLRIAIFVR
ncbi:MAG: exopolysaccharide biosynthesis polyprenyl glycosylphosphotransferase [Spirochaetales bacterium]|nr:exopolysaccharide biosynthesis polyprenyl glycosylphosphotransferase [Spirochaetales bacterium]